MTSQLHWCHVCRAKRPQPGKCPSCLTQMRPWTEPKQVHPCPACRRQHTVAMADGQRTCRDCGAVFEEDHEVADDRPDVAAMKNERRGR